MDWEKCTSQMEVFTLDTLILEKLKEKELSSSKTDPSTKENSLKTVLMIPKASINLI